MIRDCEVVEEVKRYQMVKNQRLSRFIVKLTLTLVWSACAFYTSRKLLLHFFFGSNKISEDDLYLLPSKFFFFIRRSPTFEIIWLGQLISTIMAVWIFVSYDGFFITLVFHLCAQLKILKSDLKNLVSLSEKQTFNVVLRLIVKKHLHLKR